MVFRSGVVLSESGIVVLVIFGPGSGVQPWEWILPCERYSAVGVVWYLTSKSRIQPVMWPFIGKICLWEVVCSGFQKPKVTRAAS